MNGEGSETGTFGDIALLILIIMRLGSCGDDKHRFAFTMFVCNLMQIVKKTLPLM